MGAEQGRRKNRLNVSGYRLCPMAMRAVGFFHVTHAKSASQTPLPPPDTCIRIMLSVLKQAGGFVIMSLACIEEL